MIPKGVSSVTFSYDPRLLVCFARQFVCIVHLSEGAIFKSHNKLPCGVVIYSIVCICDLKNHNTEREATTPD